jgi:hypothetical protein
MRDRGGSGDAQEQREREQADPEGVQGQVDQLDHPHAANGP